MYQFIRLLGLYAMAYMPYWLKTGASLAEDRSFVSRSQTRLLRQGLKQATPIIDPSTQRDCLRRPGSVPVIAVSLSARSATASGSTMHAADSFSTHCWASAAFARAFRVGGAAGRGVQPSCIKPCCFRRVHGVDDRHLRGERGLPGILEHVSIDSKYIGKA